MKENLTELVFILDRSGSMGGLEDDTIGGFNSLIAKQKKEEGQAYVSTVLFDDRTDVLHNRVSIEEVPPMTDDDYYVRGCTALLDAVGNAINYISKAQRFGGEANRPGKTMFVIMTDGMENSSVEYTLDDVKRMIARAQEHDHWEFLFLGANIDAIGVASSMGISKSRATNFHNDSKGQRLNYEVLGEAVTHIRRTTVMKASKGLDDGSWKKRIEEDYIRRKNK